MKFTPAVMKEKYPELYPKNSDGEVIDPECGCYFPDGWAMLIDKLCHIITLHLKYTPGIEFNIIQVKSKFGGLRFYYSGGDQYIAGMIGFAENFSLYICEDTGLPGSLCVDKTGYYRTLCPERALERGFAEIRK